MNIPRCSMRAGAFVVAMATLLVNNQSSHASLITYTETATASGSIGSMDFTNVVVTVTTVADTANIQYDSSLQTYENSGVTTVQISGVGTATFTGGDTFGAISENVGSGLGTVGIADLTALQGILGNEVSIPPFYDLATPYTATGASLYNLRGAVFSTTLGDLKFTGTTGNATFTASVPEPSSLTLFGVAAVAGLGLWSRRCRASLRSSAG